MTTPRQFDLIAFDWDGTLYDSTALIVRCIQAAVVDVGGAKPTVAAASYVIGMNLMQALAHAAPDVAPEDYPQLGARYRHHYAQHANDIVLFDGTEALLTDLQARGYKLAVATGKSRRGLDEALVYKDIGRFFHATRTADETAGKPDPRMLLELMEELGTTHGRTLMIGDTTHDLLLAKNAGCASVGVSYGAHEASGFAAFDPQFVAHSVAELHAWLKING